MIKNLLKTTMLSLLLVLAISTIPCNADTNIKGNVIAQLGFVTNIVDNNVQITTQDQNGWYLENRPDLKTQQLYIIIYNDMGTQSIYDDTIINIISVN